MKVQKSFLTHPVSCLGGGLLAVGDLAHHQHHPDLLPLHREALLGGLENLLDLDGNNVLLPLCLGFSS